MPKKNMPASSFFKEIKKIIREVDGSLQTLTGQNLQQYLAGLAKEFTDNAHRKANQPRGSDPYKVLGVTPTTPHEQIKQTYLLLVKIYHEAGSAPNPELMTMINNAYEEICRTRGWAK